MSPTRRDIIKSIAAGTVLAALPVATVAAQAPAPAPVAATPGRAVGMVIYYPPNLKSIADAKLCVLRELSDGSLRIEMPELSDSLLDQERYPSPGTTVPIPGLTSSELAARVDTLYGGAK